MHPSLDELLALRDGEGGVETTRHVSSCESCTRTLAELTEMAEALRGLPMVELGRDEWPRIRQLARRREGMKRLRVLAAAACVVIAAVAGLSIHSTRRHQGTAGFDLSDPGLAVEHLASASRELEVVLADPALRERVISSRRAAVIVDLEDRIALVDVALAVGRDDPPDDLAVALWSDRVELLDALVSVRNGTSRSDEIKFANYVADGRIR